MANSFKNAFTGGVGQSPTSVLTCPPANSSKCVLIGLQLSNTTSSEITATITLNDSSASTDVVLVNEVPIPQNSMLSVLQGDKVVLEESDVLKIHSNTASACNALVSYLLSDST